MGSDAEFLQATVQVPRHRHAEFHQWYGRWLAQDLEPVHSRDPAGWDDVPVEEAERLYGGVSTRAVKILDMLMDDPNRWFSSGEVALAAGLDSPYGVAGCLSSIGKAATRARRKLPFEWRAGQAGEPGTYRMTTPVAELFRQARDRTAR